MAVKLFISYSHVDAALVERLKKHLAQLEREGEIVGWFDQEIHAGDSFDASIMDELAKTEIFLACVSPDYIASPYCYEKELAYALKAVDKGNMAIVPLILEPCEWLNTPLKQFKAVPTDGRPVAQFTNTNTAFLGAVSEIRRLVASFERAPKPVRSERSDTASSDIRSRYRVKRDFDDLDKRDFLESASKEIYRFFVESIEEISVLNEIEGRISKFDGSTFHCTLINRGKGRAFETMHVRFGNGFGDIDLLYGEQEAKNTSHGSFHISSDDYELFFAPQTFLAMNGRSDRLSSREVGEQIWNNLLEKVGISYA